MKLLHLSSEATWRGGEQQMAYLIEQLFIQGIHSVVACRQGSAFAEYCQRQKWPYFSLPFRHSFDLRTALAIKRICARERIDLIHIHSGKSHGIATLAAALGNRVPLVLSRRVDFPIRQNTITQWKYNHSKVRKIVCVSEAIEKIVREGVRHPERCVTVHSGINPRRFGKPAGYLKERYAIAPETLLIGNTSALADHKDYYTFVDTAELVLAQRPDVVFFIIGEGSEEAAIQEYITRKGLDDHVLMTGFLTNLNEILPELDIFLITSQTEGLGTSILDAFACRIPVVATAAGGIPEMVKHEVTGLLAPVKQADLLARHVLRLIQNPALQQDLSERANQLLMAEFTHEVMAQRTAAIYREVVP